MHDWIEDLSELVDPDEVSSKVAFSHWRSACGFLFILPGGFVAASVNRANEEMKADYAAKSLDTVRISSNLRSHQAVVFFKIPDDLPHPFGMEDAFIEAKVYEQGKDDQLTKVFDLVVHFQ